MAYVPAYAKQIYFFTNYQITSLWLGFFTLTVISRLVLTRKNETRFLKRMLVACLAISILMLITIGLASTSVIFSMAVVLIGLSHGFIYPVTALLIVKNSPTGQRLATNTLYTVSFDLGNALGPVIASVMVGYVPINLTFIGSAVLPAGLFVVVLKNINFVSKE